MSQHQCRIPLMADLAAAAGARAVVQDCIRTWRVPVDADVAILLTSELVTNAVTHGSSSAGGTFVLLTVAWNGAGLRVDVHDGSADLPVLSEAELPSGGLASAGHASAGLDEPGLDPAWAEAETGRGLLLVTSLSAEWGFYRTEAGKAVYFTLELKSAGNETVTTGPKDRGSTSVS